MSTPRELIQEYAAERAALKRDVKRLCKALRDVRQALIVINDRCFMGQQEELSRSAVTTINEALARKARHDRR